MNPVKHVTTVMVLTALAAVGCSKGSDSSAAKKGTDTTVQPVAKETSAVATKDLDEEGPVTAVAKLATSTSFDVGEAAFKAKKYAEATSIFEGYTQRRPTSAWGHYMLGLSAWKSGDVEKSEKAFDTALALDPHHVKSLVNSGRLFIDQKRYEDAIDRLTKATEIDPDSIEVNRLLARTYADQGKKEEAIAAYRHVIELNAHDAWSLNNLGLLLLESKQADEALPLLAKAVELRKDVAMFHNNFGMALEHTGRFRAAAAAYSSALAADPGYDKAKANLARVELVKSGDEEPFTRGTPDETDK